jgi:hypothetical protein
MINVGFALASVFLTVYRHERSFSKPWIEPMNVIEIALRTAINVFLDSADSGAMPSVMLLDAASLQLHERAADVLKQLQDELVA